MSSLLARACAACILVSWAFTCLGADKSALTLRDALVLTAERNPELAAFQPQLEAARQQSAAQSLRPANAIELQLENFAGSGDLSGTRALETTLQLSHVIELGGKTGARHELGEMEVTHLGVAQQVRQADLFAEAARRFVHVLADQEQLQAARRATALARETGAAARLRVEAGAASSAQASRAGIALARAHIVEEHAEHELASSRVALSVLWNEPIPAFGEARGALFALGVPEPFETYAARLDSNPELLTFASSERVTDARLRLAESQQRANLTLNVGVRRLEAFDDAAFVAGIVMPIGSSRRMQSEIQAVRAERSALEFTRTSRRLELHSTLFGLYQEMLHARAEAQALQDQIRPQAQVMLRTTQEGYRAGRFSFLELADAQQHGRPQGGGREGRPGGRDYAECAGVDFAATRT